MSETAKQIVQEHAEQGAVLRAEFFEQYTGLVVEVGRTMAVTLAEGGKILFCGNGGSAADAQHLAAEFVNRFMLERPPLPAIALTTDTSALTAISNDYGFDQVFEKQVQALGSKGDMLVAISTSGNSENILAALRAARDKGMISVGLTGNAPNEMTGLCSMYLSVAGKNTALIQEVHIAVGHMLCRLVDYFLFESVLELQPYLGQGGAAE